MPVRFLTASQRESYGRYVGVPPPEALARYFHLDDADRALIAQKYGDHNRLGFAVQLASVRYLGAFVEEVATVPAIAVQTLARQLAIADVGCLAVYADHRQRWAHTVEIRERYGYREFVESAVGFRVLSRILEKGERRWLPVVNQAANA
jgi:hypothetical protein